MSRSALRSLCLVGLALLLASSSRAADPAPAEAGASQPSPAKLEKIRKVLKATGSDDAGDGLTRIYLAQLQKIYPQVIEQVMKEEPDLSAEDAEALRKKLSDFDAFAQRFAERFPSRFDAKALIDETFIPLYDKNFDEDELETMAEFYGTEAGQKTLKLLPVMMNEGLRAMLAKTDGSANEMVGEILAELRGADPAGGAGKPAAAK